MRKHLGWRVRLAVALVVAAVAAWRSRRPARADRHSGLPPRRLKCGLGNGQKATGTPIKLGAIAVKQAGTDFTDIPNMAKAYFTASTTTAASTGTRSSRISLTDQTTPAQVARRRQAADPDRPRRRHRRQLGHHRLRGQQRVLRAAAASTCSRPASPSSATRARTRRRSTWVRATAPTARRRPRSRYGAKKIAFDQSNVPGTQYNLGGSKLIAKQHHIPITFLTENAAAINGATAAEKEVQAAGTGGAVVLVFTPPVALADPPGRAAARPREQGHLDLRDAVQHRLAGEVAGPQWNHKLYVNAEMNDVHDRQRPGRRRSTCRCSSSTARPSPAASARSASSGSRSVSSRSRRCCRSSPTSTRRRRSTPRSRRSRASRRTCSASPGTSGRAAEQHRLHGLAGQRHDADRAEAPAACRSTRSTRRSRRRAPTRRRTASRRRTRTTARRVAIDGAHRTSMPSWSDFQPFIPIGLALGGVYALSGVGMVVLYRATGVLNLAFGAIGAMGALIAWSMINQLARPERRRVRRLRALRRRRDAGLRHGLRAACSPARDPLVKAAATLGLALLLLGRDEPAVAGADHALAVSPVG